MKHTKMLTKPAKAQEVAWIQLKDIIAPTQLSDTQAMWLAAQWDNWLQK